MNPDPLTIRDHRLLHGRLGMPVKQPGAWPSAHLLRFAGLTLRRKQSAQNPGLIGRQWP